MITKSTLSSGVFISVLQSESRCVDLTSVNQRSGSHECAGNIKNINTDKIVRGWSVQWERVRAAEEAGDQRFQSN